MVTSGSLSTSSGTCLPTSFELKRLILRGKYPTAVTRMPTGNIFLLDTQHILAWWLSIAEKGLLEWGGCRVCGVSPDDSRENRSVGGSASTGVDCDQLSLPGRSCCYRVDLAQIDRLLGHWCGFDGEPRTGPFLSMFPARNFVGTDSMLLVARLVRRCNECGSYVSKYERRRTAVGIRWNPNTKSRRGGL